MIEANSLYNGTGDIFNLKIDNSAGKVTDINLFDFRDICPNKDEIYIMERYVYIIDQVRACEMVEFAEDWIGFWNGSYNWRSIPFPSKVHNPKNMIYSDYTVYTLDDAGFNYGIRTTTNKCIVYTKGKILPLDSNLKKIVVK